MSILIKGMEMPKDRPQLLWVYPNGKALIVQSDVDPWKELQAVPVPPHGRLGDLDAIKKEFDRICDEFDACIIDEMNCLNMILASFNNAPTIIPAQGKGYILAPQEEYDGLKRKYVVLKSDTGECVENCFVLRPDKDKAAIAALLAYADATDNHVLAKDIRAWISTIPAEEEEK